MPHLKTLADCTSLPPAQIRKAFGGKALGLFEAHQLGIPVPLTWFLSSDHFEKLLAQNPTLDPRDFQNLARDSIYTLLEEEMKKLPEGKFAIRSSGWHEDSNIQSYAGIFETKLNIAKQDIPDAIASVWESSFSLRALSYQTPDEMLTMGIIIQPMVTAKFSGVLFSRHPSPSNVFENRDIVIEFAHASGEKVAGGQVIPLRLTGSFETLSTLTDFPWINPLLKATLHLTTAYQHDVDIEFTIDQNEQFWLLQQRPISKTTQSHTLDLSAYQRAYKRSLCTLDIELLIEGCSKHLASYLEVPYSFDRWMLMISDKEGEQELWIHQLLNDAVTAHISRRILENHLYLEKIGERYATHHQSIFSKDYTPFLDQSTPLETRFFDWCEFITPLCAHYYIPMFLIDALFHLLKSHVIEVDPENGEKDLLWMGTAGITTLIDHLHRELKNLKETLPTLPLSVEHCDQATQAKLLDLCLKYGFLKCHQIYESGYTEKDLFDMMCTLPEIQEKDQTSKLEEFSQKYFSDPKWRYLFDQLRSWVRIRNQEMEYFIYAIVQSRSLFEEISAMLGITIKQFWTASKEVLFAALKKRNSEIVTQFPTHNLAIFRSYGKTRVLPNIHIQGLSKPNLQAIRGKTVFGKGQLKARVVIANDAKDLESLPPFKEPFVLITGMTTPDFIPAMRKQFSALITDEGGILCHAAIVAREIAIPTIVGTGIATGRFRPGQMIVIDFDTGEVNVA